MNWKYLKLTHEDEKFDTHGWIFNFFCQIIFFREKLSNFQILLFEHKTLLFKYIYIWLKSVEPTILVQYYMSMISMLTSTLLRVRNINFIASNIDIMDKSLAAQIHVFIQYLHLFEWRLLMAIFNLGKNWVLRFWLILKMGYVP